MYFIQFHYEDHSDIENFIFETIEETLKVSKNNKTKSLVSYDIYYIDKKNKSLYLIISEKKDD